MNALTLYGTPGSLYTGKARAYLIKAGIKYKEVTIAGEHFQQVVKPLAETSSVPCIEFSDGRVIRDGTRIIEHFEQEGGRTFSPPGSRQRILSYLFDLIGSEGLLRPAMHYRWDFPEHNADFIRFFFESMIPLTVDKKKGGEKIMSIMSGAGKAFGAVPENFEIIENLYESFLDKLNAHFLVSPYLFGGKPSIGDFGLMAAMYAHLGRDPKPLALMQAKALGVFRWVERMNRPDADIGEFNDQYQENYLLDDEIPETLIVLLRHIATDLVPETLAAAISINDWLASENPQALVPIQRGVGFANFELQGKTLNALAQPYRFYLLKRMQDEYESLPQEEKDSVDQLFKECGLVDLLSVKLDRAIEWKGNREVWA